MKNVIISCLTLEKEIKTIMEAEQVSIPIYFLPYELHASPEKLHGHLQALIDTITDADKIMLCISNCGNGTDGLKSANSQLVIQKTTDCLDILLSDKNIGTTERDSHGIFITESWLGSFKNSSLDLNTLTKKLGRKQAEEKLKNIYRGYTDFYIIDTDAYNLEPVRDYITPLVELLNGSLHIVKGRCGILHKMITDNIDEDFYIVPNNQYFKR